MKKILIFSTAYHPFVGGAEIAVKEITDRLSHEDSAGAGGFEFDMITLNLDGKQKAEEKIGNVNVYRIGNAGKVSKLFFPFAALGFASHLHGKKRYDAIWSIMASFSGFGAMFFKKKYPMVPFILTLQEGDPIEYILKQVQFVNFWFKQIFTRADYIQTISTYLADWAKNMGATAPITVIPNGVDVKMFSQNFSEQELTVLRQELFKKTDDVYLVTTSRLEEKNGVVDIIKALPHLPAHVKLLVIGDGSLRVELETLVKGGEVVGRVIFLGQKDHKDIPKYLKVSDIFVRPSLSEGMGNSFIEAMAAGIPVIATRVGGIPDFLYENETGLFCEVENPFSIADQVKKLLENKELRDTLVANAQKLVQEKYDWSFVAERMKTEIFAKV
jgi:glycosyltransferase involved in cell wall biosynthesis